jgi:restriction endonuclease S subunit
MNSLKLGDVASITTGLVVKRKEIPPGEEPYSIYSMLTLRSFDQGGWLNENGFDVFRSIDEIDPKYLTREGDIIIRLSSPNTAITIDKQHENVLVPSLFVLIRITEQGILPEYVILYLNSDKMRKNYIKESSGSTIQTIKTSAFKDFIIQLPEIDLQKKSIELSLLMKKEKRLLVALMEQNEKRNNSLITQIANGGLKDGN